MLKIRYYLITLLLLFTSGTTYANTDMFSQYTYYLEMYLYHQKRAIQILTENPNVSTSEEVALLRKRSHQDQCESLYYIYQIKRMIDMSPFFREMLDRNAGKDMSYDLMEAFYEDKKSVEDNIKKYKVSCRYLGEIYDHQRAFVR